MTETLRDRAKEIAHGPHCFAGNDITGVINELLEGGARNRLPNRRLAVTRRVVWQTETSEHKFYITIGIHPETLTIMEVFYADGQRSGSQLQHAIQDACILISLLLQYGVKPADIGKSLSTMLVFGNDTPASIIGAVVNAIKDW